MYVYTAGGNKTYTNAKSVKLNTSDGKIKKNKLTLKVKDTYKIKASVKKADKKKNLMPASHVKAIRYCSSDPSVATVSTSGKITAKKKVKCNIYVYAHNGVGKTITLTVK
ncbi:MAG: Ig-like domain-containing protein [Eubacterium sp.]|nr:Ig-like domain-containing protein [Eubacterium sp.]